MKVIIWMWKKQQLLKLYDTAADSVKKELDSDSMEKPEESEVKNGLTSTEEEEGFEEFDGYRIPLKLWNKLYRYQQTCVRWLWELYCQRCGGIVGDEMGLGKTIQIIAYFVGLNSSSPDPNTRGLGPVIIVCPTTVMHQWVKEFHNWWPPFRVAILHDSGSCTGTKESLVRNINQASGILITSYSGISQHLKSLLRYKWHYIVLDEGHKIRNPDAQATLACKQFRTPNRIILSGSPMQNNLKELWSLFDFVFPGKLGTLPVFMQQFSVPITQGGYANASKVQVETAYRCAVVLRDTISPYLLRRMKADVNMVINLPKKNEQVLFCGLTDDQRELYKDYLNSKEVKSILDGRLQVFVGLTHLRKICNHADLYSGGPKVFGNASVEHLSEEMHYGYWKRSGKMIVVESVLKMWHQQKHRVLLFSQSKQMLDIMERFVKTRDYTYLRMDGTTSIGSRQPLVHKFNNDPNIFVFLLTTRVGGLGVNLIGANKVILFDPDWNPSTDMQARERAWRIGQVKDVTVYRLLTAGTIEEKIYHRQIFKQFLTNRVLKDPRQRRFFKSNQLFELFTLKDDGVQGGTETSSIFAGTGSNVKLKRLKETKAESSDLTMSSQKMEKMRELAKKLSQKLIENMDKGKNADPSEAVKKTSAPVKIKRSSTGAKFEGRRHSYLVKADVFKPSCEEEDHSQTNAKQDEFVLRTLFSKAGVHGALKHDKIMDASDPDYMLVEGEAEKVAKEAVKALKLSQRQCHRADSGIPTWTGANGHMTVIKSKSRFGKKKSIIERENEKPSPTKPVASTSAFSGEKQSNDNVELSSSDLLKRMKERNATIRDPEWGDDDESEMASLDTEIRTTTEYDELLVNIRNCVAFQCAVDGQASTSELLEIFRDRLPSKDSAIFKALLLRVCDLHKDSSGNGIWRLKEEFR